MCLTGIIQENILAIPNVTNQSYVVETVCLFNKEYIDVSEKQLPNIPILQALDDILNAMKNDDIGLGQCHFETLLEGIKEAKNYNYSAIKSPVAIKIQDITMAANNNKDTI